ncbi:MAG TPA: GNAT family N-acetyltransferase [Chitinophagaceae bacterium]|nr:GNAT family N-acetyltransferase [Chitinophagaceae bacterium]
MNGLITIRYIKQDDNDALALIVRNSLAEFNAAKPGTVFYDVTTDHLYEVFQKERSKYFVVEMENTIAGGAGIYPTPGLEDDTCELVKMYLIKKARGRGIGKILLQKCIEEAMQQGYKKIYLESMPELKLAIPMYEKFGFTFLKGPKGNSGHTGCDVWMMKEL